MKNFILTIAVLLLAVSQMGAQDRIVAGVTIPENNYKPIYFLFDKKNLTATVTWYVNEMFPSQTSQVDYVGEVYIPGTVNYAGNSYTVTAIGEQAFANCEDLTTVSIPSTVERIESKAFENCTGLIVVKLEEDSEVPVCDDDAFDGCDCLIEGFIVHHMQRMPTQSTLGYAVDCWESVATGKFYEDDKCTTELNPAKVVTYAKLKKSPCKTADGFTFEESGTFGDCQFNWVASTSYAYYEGQQFRSVEFVVGIADADNARIKWFKDNADPGYGRYSVKIYVNGVSVYEKQQESDEELEGLFVVPLPGLKLNDVVRFELDRVGSRFAGTTTIAACLEYTHNEPVVHHEQCEPTFATVGYAKECWEDGEGRMYLNSDLTNEVDPMTIVTYLMPLNSFTQADGFNFKESGTYRNCKFDWMAETLFEDVYDYGTRYAEFVVQASNPSNARIKWFKDCGHSGYGFFIIKVFVNGNEVYSYTQAEGEILDGLFEVPLSGLKKGDVVKFEVTRNKGQSWAGSPVLAACLEYTGYYGNDEPLFADSPVGTVGMLCGKQAMVVDLGGDIGKVAVAMKNEGATDALPYGPLREFAEAQEYTGLHDGWYIPTKAELEALNNVLEPNSDNTALKYTAKGNTLELQGTSFDVDGFFGMYVNSEDNTLLMFIFDGDDVTRQFEALDPSSVSSCAIRPFHKLPDHALMELQYTTTDGKVMNPYMENAFDAVIIGNTYIDDKGVIVFNGPVTSIEKNAFWACATMSSITLPTSVSTIGQNAFIYCYNLKSLTLPKSLTYIDSNAFSDCTGLTDVYVEWISDIASINSAAFGNVNLSTVTLHVPYGTKTAYQSKEVWKKFGEIVENQLGNNEIYYVSNDGKAIEPSASDDAFDAKIVSNSYYPELNIGFITFDGDVTSIGPSAFEGCTTISAVALPNCVKSIGPDAFNGCTSMTSVTIPNIVESIGKYAFSGCTNLTSVVIPRNVKSIREGAFNGCSSLASVSIPRGITTIEWSTFSGCKSLATVTFPSGLTSIEGTAFEECESLKSLTIPDGVTKIGYAAFEWCYGLTTLTIPSSVTSIGEKSFGDCNGLTDVYVDWTSDFPTTDARTFANVDLSKATLHVPYRTKSVYQSKEVWKEFGNITVDKQKHPSNEIWYTSTDGKIVTPYDKSVFGAAFKDNTYRNGRGVITFNGTVTTIGEWAFFGCSKLATIELPAGVTTIGMGAFMNCPELMSVYMPETLESIEDMQFAQCSKLDEVLFKSMPLMKGNGIFSHSSEDLTITFDLYDSEKPYITTSVDNYPTSSQAIYTRSSTKGSWGTIILPFVPETTEGLEFYELSSMTTEGDGALSFTKVETVEAGKPYLFKNKSAYTEFTLTASNPTFTVTPQDKTTGNGFSMKGNFQAAEYDGKENGNLYYLKDNEFYHATGRIIVNPFRAYIEGDGSVQVKSLMLIIEGEFGEVNAIPGILDDKGEIDETIGIYDLSGRQLDAPRKGQVNIIRTKSGKTVKRLF